MILPEFVCRGSHGSMMFQIGHPLGNPEFTSGRKVKVLCDGGESGGNLVFLYEPSSPIFQFVGEKRIGEEFKAFQFPHEIHGVFYAMKKGVWRREVSCVLEDALFGVSPRNPLVLEGFPDDRRKLVPEAGFSLGGGFVQDILFGMAFAVFPLGVSPAGQNHSFFSFPDVFLCGEGQERDG